MPSKLKSTILKDFFWIRFNIFLKLNLKSPEANVMFTELCNSLETRHISSIYLKWRQREHFSREEKHDLHRNDHSYY